MIYSTIQPTEFAHWIAKSDSYKHNFSYEGANALQEYLDELSEDLGENFEFDPIAWCCEYSEYANLAEIQADYPDIKTLDDLQDATIVIEFDNGLIIQDF